MEQSLLNTRCVQVACKNLCIPYNTYDNNKNLIEVLLHNKPYIFVNFSTPFNSDSVSYICKDKDFTYKLLKSLVQMPRTLAFFDPHYENEAFKKYIVQTSYDEITREICKTFSLPVIVKMNSGSMGRNVFLCNSKEEVFEALEAIYKKDSPLYDYIALAQEYVPILKEYRVVTFEKEIILMYEKDFSNSTYIDNISPLHRENSKAVLIEDRELQENIQSFLKPVLDSFNIQFAGLDIILDESGNMFLLEINSKPGFSYFVKDNGEERLVQMYEQIFNKILKLQ